MPSAVQSIIGQSKAIQDILDLVKKAADSKSSILVQGETGTGKELIARALHEESPRAQGPFIVANCSALPETLLESELFGHERGAFTGAFRTRRGRFELANQGTLFLDEIAEVGPAIQMKLLRVLQEGEFQRVGGEDNIKVDVRIIAATNRDLRAEVKQRRFREDLFYRLNVIPIFVPPLRYRRSDIPLLAKEFSGKYSVEGGRTPPEFEARAMEALVRYDWPGNVRELENVVERAVLLTQAPVIRLDDLPIAISRGKEISELAAATGPSALRQTLTEVLRESPDLEMVKQTLKELYREVEKESIVRALTQTGWAQRKAARTIGIDESTLRYLMKRYGIARPDRRLDQPQGTES